MFAVLGVLVYALLGNIAELFYNCSFYIMRFVMLGQTCSGNFIDFTLETACSYDESSLKYGFMTNFNFLDVQAGSSLDQVGTWIQKLINYVWYIGWIILIACALAQIIQLLNANRSGSGAWLSVTVRTLFTIGLYYNWYPILNSVLNTVNTILAGPMRGFAWNLQNNANPDAATIFGWGDGLASLADSSPGMFIFACLLCFSLGTAVLRASFTYLERYFSAAIYVYISPIAVAFNVNENTASTFKDWLVGLIPQTFGLFVSALFMLIGFKFVSNIGEGASMRDVIYGLALAIVFMGFSSNTEKFFNSVGIRTMSHGDAARSALAGAGAMMMATRAALGAARAAANSPIGKKIDGMTAAAADGAMDKVFGKPLTDRNGKPLTRTDRHGNAAPMKGRVDNNGNLKSTFSQNNADRAKNSKSFAQMQNAVNADKHAADVEQKARDAATVSAAAASARVSAEQSARESIKTNSAVKGVRAEAGSTATPQDIRDLNSIAARGQAEGVQQSAQEYIASHPKAASKAMAKMEEARASVSSGDTTRGGDAYARAFPTTMSQIETTTGGKITENRAFSARTSGNSGVIMNTSTVDVGGKQQSVTTAVDRAGHQLAAGTMVRDGSGQVWQAVNDSSTGMTVMQQTDAPMDSGVNSRGVVADLISDSNKSGDYIMVNDQQVPVTKAIYNNADLFGKLGETDYYSAPSEPPVPIINSGEPSGKVTFTTPAATEFHKSAEDSLQKMVEFEGYSKVDVSDARDMLSKYPDTESLDEILAAVENDDDVQNKENILAVLRNLLSDGPNDSNFGEETEDYEPRI